MAYELADISSWSASASISGGYSGNLQLENKTQQYDPETYLWNPIKIDLTGTATTSGVTDDSCFSGTTTWIQGLVTSFGDNRSLFSDKVRISTGSFFETLKNKPVNTHRFNEAASGVINEVLRVFAGVPSGLISITLTSFDMGIVGIVSGNNLYEETKKIAVASRADLFVQTDGVLSVQNWKDSSDSVDITIPKEAIWEAKQNVASERGPSRIHVRGRHISRWDAGSQILSPLEKEEPTEPVPGKDPGEQGMRIRKVRNGIGQSRIKVRLKGLTGDLCDLKNSAVRVSETCLYPDESVSSDPSTIRQAFGDRLHTVNKVKNGAIEMFVTDDCDSYLESGEHEWSYDVIGRKRSKGEYDNPGTKRKQAQKGKGNVIRTVKNISRRLLKGVPVPSWVGDEDDDNSGDESDKQRIEMVVGDSDLYSEFGVVSEQIDNLYISDYETLFETAIRRFQDFKMRRKTWSVKCVYMPCLQLNQVVRFTTPDNQDTITGLLTDIKVDFRSDNHKSTMTLSVQSFEDIGSTSYTSGNLFMYPDLIGANGENWYANALVRMLGTYVAFRVGGVLTQTFSLEVGAQYTLTAVVSGGAFSMTMGATGAYGVGTLSITFTAASIINVAGFSSITGGYLLSVSLIKTVTR